jgi:hypothetical protein
LIKPLYKRIRFIRSNIENYFPFVNLPDSKWSILDTFDSVTPVYASTHKYSEVLEWVTSQGFNKIVKTQWGDGSLFAIKNTEYRDNELQ